MTLSHYAGRGMATNKKDAAAPAGLMDQARDEGGTFRPPGLTPTLRTQTPEFQHLKDEV